MSMIEGRRGREEGQAKTVLVFFFAGLLFHFLGCTYLGLRKERKIVELNTTPMNHGVVVLETEKVPAWNVK